MNLQERYGITNAELAVIMNITRVALESEFFSEQIGGVLGLSDGQMERIWNLVRCEDEDANF